ncbi:MAG: hypothetical protein WCB04_12000 [Mycobacteriales bacterium]
MRVVVIGGSAAGQFAALLLARAGHAVVLLDQDDLAPRRGVDTAAVSFRPAAPQTVQPHALLPRCRLLLREHLMDVYDALLAAGALESTLDVASPPDMHIAPQPGDEDYTSIATRRSTLDLILRRAVAAQPGLTCRFGVRTTGLVADPGSPPLIRGVRTDTGELHADLVVDATGRRTHVDRWLTQVGAEATTVVAAECGLAYHSRHYRVRAGRALPGHPATRLLFALDEFTTGLWNCDNGTATIAIAPLVQDRRFRGVKEPAVFDAVARTVPAYRPWLEVLEPTSDVFVMAGLHNTFRRLLTDGRPVATGLALVGDSRCTTNPTFGRGLPLALIEAADLLRATETDGDDRLQLTRELERRALEHVEPFYRDQAHNDAVRLAGLRHTIFGAPLPSLRPSPDAVTFTELRMSMPLHADALRAFWRVMGMLDLPDRIYTDHEVVRRTRQLLGTTADVPPFPQPTRSDLEAVLSGEVTPV